MILLDTDHISELEQIGMAGERLFQRLSALPAGDIAVSIISYEEQTRGWLSYLARARSLEAQIEAYRRLQVQLENYCSLTVLAFDGRAVEEFTRLQKLPIRIGTMDMKIAAIALAHKATLLSRNLRDFSKVPDLRVEDWTA